MSTDVVLDLVVSHARPSHLVITLINPIGTEVVVFDRQPVNHQVYLRSFRVFGFPGDEPANGTWTLRAVDTETGATGTLNTFALTIASRSD